MYPKSSHVGHPRSPFKLSAFINASVFTPQLGFEVFPVRRCPLASNPTTNGICGVFCSRAPTPNCIRGVIDYLGLEKVEGVHPSLMPKMPFMEPATCIQALCRTASKVVHHLSLGLFFAGFISDWRNLFTTKMYSQYPSRCVSV